MSKNESQAITDAAAAAPSLPLLTHSSRHKNKAAWTLHFPVTLREVAGLPGVLFLTELET